MKTRKFALVACVAIMVMLALRVYLSPNEAVLDPKSNLASDVPVEATPGETALWNFSEFPLKASLKETPEEIEKVLGQPLSHNKKPVKNTHVENQIDTIHELKYDGVQINVYESNGADKKWLLESLIIEKNTFELREGIKIGMKKSEVLAQFGEPESADENSIHYTSGSEAGNTITLHFKDDALVKIDWLPYFG